MASLVLQTSFMSLHESIISSSLLIILSSITWKWNKSLMVIISLELISVIIISSFYYSGIFSSMLLMLLVFFVGEALIILSSLYSTMSLSGVINSSLIFW